ANIFSRILPIAVAITVLATAQANTAHASSATIVMTPPAQQAVVNTSFNVTITQNATVQTKGVQTDVAFDPMRLHLISVSRGGPYATASLLMGVAPQTPAQAIWEANQTGVLKNLATVYLVGQTIPVGPADALVISMLPCTPGTSTLSMSHYEMLDDAG